MSNVNGNSGNLELQICALQDKLLGLVEQEDNLRELKKEAAADFREQINAVHKQRLETTKELKALQTAEVESEGTFIIEAAEVKSAPQVTA